MTNLSFDQLRHANDERAVEWNSGPPLSAEFAMIELAGEVGEACNSLKKWLRHRHGLAGGVASLEPVIQELADVVICTDLLARKLGVDLGAAVAMKFNHTSRKHGFNTMLPEPVPTACGGPTP